MTTPMGHNASIKGTRPHHPMPYHLRYRPSPALAPIPLAHKVLPLKVQNQSSNASRWWENSEINCGDGCTTLTTLNKNELYALRGYVIYKLILFLTAQVNISINPKMPMVFLNTYPHSNGLRLRITVHILIDPIFVSWNICFPRAWSSPGLVSVLQQIRGWWEDTL